MNELKIQPDDPRLTAHALGELEGDEAAAVAAAVAADPALQAAVADIRAAAGSLTAALEAEPLPIPEHPVHRVSYHTVRPARIFRFPYWATAGLAAAACLVLVFTLREWPGARPAPAKQVAKTVAAENAGKPSPAEAGGDLPGSPITVQFQKAAEARTPNESIAVVTPLARTAPPSAANAGALAVAPTGAPAPHPATEIEDQRARITVAAAKEKTAVAAEPVLAAAPAGSAIDATNVAEPGSAVIYRPERRVRALAVAQAAGGETADAARDNAFLSAPAHPSSTFGIDVIPTAYGDVRRALLGGRRPSRAAVRIEELLNHFTYDYAAPKPADPDPFAATLEVASAPWAPTHRLVRIGLRARAAADGAPGPIARDVRVEVDFNASRVQAYRLLGYENGPGPAGDTSAAIAAQIRAGHAVTALYEVIPAGVAWTPDSAAAAHFEHPANPEAAVPNPQPRAELLTMTLRYRAPDGGPGGQLEYPLVDRGESFAGATVDFKFAAAVAGFGLVLRDSPFKGSATLGRVVRWAEEGLGADPGGDRAEFISLVKRAEEILPSQG